MSTRQTTETLEHLSQAERKAAEIAAKAQAEADAAKARAQEARDRAQQARTDAGKRYAMQVRGAYKDRRPEALKAVASAREAFAAAVLAGEPFGPSFLAIVQAEAALYAVELEYAEALSRLGQSPLKWPEPATVNLADALTAVLQREASRLATEAADAMKAERRRWINQQVANDHHEGGEAA